MLIGLCGLPGTGKDEIATYLAKSHGFRLGKMAAGLKLMLHAFLKHGGLEESEIWRMLEGELKEVSHPLLCGKTPRWAMQSLGTEWGRDCIGADIWGNLWDTYTKAALDNGVSVVCSDIRFPNEQERIRRMGGFMVKVEREGRGSSAHASDNMDWLMADYTIRNTGTIAELRAKVDHLLKEIQEHVWDEQPLPHREGHS